MLNLINRQPDIDNSFLSAIDPQEQKYQLLINKWEKVGLKCFKYLKAFTEYSSNMNGVYKNIEKYNTGKNVKY